jgi:AraC-like DNA-binding protein/Flp pilus assembly protein TadD
MHDIQQQAKGHYGEAITNLREYYLDLQKKGTTITPVFLKNNRKFFKKNSLYYFTHTIAEISVLDELSYKKDAAILIYMLERNQQLRKNHAMRCYYYFYSGTYFSFVNDLEKGLLFLKKAEKENEFIGDKILRINILHNIGVVYGQMQKPSEAIYHLDKACKQAKQANITDLGLTTDLAIAYMLNRQFEKAEGKMLEVYDQRKNTDGNAELNLGYLYIQMGRFEESAKQNLLALEIAKKRKDDILLGHCSANLAVYYEQLKDYKTAMKYKAYSDSIEGIILNEQLRNSLDSMQSINFRIERDIDQRLARRNLRIEQVKKNQLIIGLAGSLAIITILIIFYVRLSAKNKRLVQLQLNAIESDNQSLRSRIGNENPTALDLELLQKFEALLINQKWYRKPDVSLAILAKKLQSNTTELSELVNKNYQNNFRALINSMRISEAKKLLADQQADNYSIDGIALEVGYKNSSTFYKNFREITGVTPSTFQRISRKIIQDDLKIQNNH